MATTSTNPAADLSHTIAENKRRALLSLTAFGLLFLVVGLVVGLVIGVLVLGVVAGLVVGAGLALFAFLRSDRIVLARSRAVAAGVADHPRYHNLVEGLCVAAGLPKPDLYVVDDAACNALVVGRDAKHSSIVVTTGLLDELNRVELEGVLACELARIKSHDPVPATAAVVPALVLGPLASVFAPPRPEQVLEADAAGVQLTRYPPGLCSALRKLQDGRAAVRNAPRAAATMWFVSPAAAPTGDTTGRAPYPPLGERIRILEEM